MDNAPKLTSLTQRSSSFFICLVGLLCICYSIMLRSEISYIGQEILKQFAITPNQLADLLVKYQLALLFTLLVAGLIIDFTGTRIILFFALCTAIFGNYLFGHAHSLNELINGRIIIGFSHPFILIGVLKLSRQYLSRNTFALFVGFLFACLLLTPQVSKNLMYIIKNYYGWELIDDILNGAGLILILLFLATSRSNITRVLPMSKIIWAKFYNKNIWMLGLISCFGWVLNTFLLNWGALYFFKGLNIMPNVAVATVQQSFLYFALGGVLIGGLAYFIENTRILITIFYLLAAMSFSFILFLPHPTISILGSLLFITSFCASAAILTYVKAYDFSDSSNAGLVFSLIAFITTGGNTLFAWILTKVYTPLLQSPRAIDTHAWQHMLIAIPIALAIGGLLALALSKAKVNQASYS
jgi:predicted MFS family arabinose efflux permease